jgi:hypothetical protein
LREEKFTVERNYQNMELSGMPFITVVQVMLLPPKSRSVVGGSV